MLDTEMHEILRRKNSDHKRIKNHKMWYNYTSTHMFTGPTTSVSQSRTAVAKSRIEGRRFESRVAVFFVSKGNFMTTALKTIKRNIMKKPIILKNF